MARARHSHLFLIVLFGVIIFTPAILQLGIESAHGQRPRAFDLFSIKPTAPNLHAYEKSLEDNSWVVKHLRPWMQFAQFVLLRQAGDKALIGRDGWFFYKPGVDYLTRRPSPRELAAAGDPLPAMVAFRDQLALRGIQLLLLPMPNKESVYPDKLSARAGRMGSIISPVTASLFLRARAAGIEVMDLFDLFARSSATESPAAPPDFYLAQDSHWSPSGVQRAAQAVGERLLQRGWVRRGAAGFEAKAVPVSRVGDVLRMLQSPLIERHTPPEAVRCLQVADATGAPFRPVPEAEVLILGDSFLRIYEHDEPGSAGFIAHLARELQQPIAAIVNDGGASTLVRQELYRRPALLARKKVVIWEFVERDIRYGTEGWQVIPLPPDPSSFPKSATAEAKQSSTASPLR